MGPAGPAVSLFRMRPAKVAAGSFQSYFSKGFQKATLGSGAWPWDTRLGPAGPAVSLFRMRPAKVAAGSSQSYTFLRAPETNVRQWRCFACARQRWQPAASRATFQRVSERVVRTGQVHAAWPPAIGWFCIPDTHAHTPTYTPTHTPTHTHL